MIGNILAATAICGIYLFALATAWNGRDWLDRLLMVGAGMAVVFLGVLWVASEQTYPGR